MFNRRLLVSTSEGGSELPTYQMISGTSSRYIGYNRDDNVGTMELWNWITGNPGEITGFNVKVVSI